MFWIGLIGFIAVDLAVSAPRDRFDEPPMLALGSGSWFGQGLFNGTQTQAGSGSLPARHTDFIFAMIGDRRTL